MALTWPVVLAVMLGALMHASWNAIVKSSVHKDMDLAVMHLMGSLLAVPLVAWFGWPDPKAWPYIAATVIIHIGYYTALVGAYQHGDLGLTYPLMRGLAPLLVALTATVTVGESLSALSWVGVACISTGVLVLGLSAHARAAPKAIGFALTNAVIIASYTVVDALGVRASGNAAQYIATLFLFAGWPFGLMMYARHGRKLLVYGKSRWASATGGAAASLLSYGIALWAMTRAPVATVAALRETSVLFAVLLGMWFLKESFTPRRVLGTLVIVAGVMALRMG